MIRPMHFALGLAVVIALVSAAVLALGIWGALDLPRVSQVPPLKDGPSVSLIIAARDEERHIEAAVRALLAQRYPRLELIVVNDRSTDATAEILARVAATDPRLQIETVDKLPDGWLGKNHAMQRGAERSTGELLLFADADVVFEPDAVARAVRLLRMENADNVTLFPGLLLPDVLLTVVVLYGFMWAFAIIRPWRTRNPGSSTSMGIGAFNLVRRSAFDAVGGFHRIPLRPDDDLMLGKVLKRHGARQIVANGIGTISIEWYRTLGEAARAFRKNTFAALNYSLSLAAVVVAVNLVFTIWPFAALALTAGVTRVWYVAAVIAQLLAFAWHARVQRTRPVYALLYPVGAIASVGIMCAAVLRTVRRQGIEWRGTFYPLDALRANRL